MLRGVAKLVDVHCDGKRCGIMILAEKYNLGIMTEDMQI
jgi:hypothetical protein